MTDFSHDNSDAKEALDKIIRKSRIHLYKPIQIAEILYHHRVHQDIDLSDLESYRNPSKRWRDEVCQRLVGRISTSTQKYQDDLFNANAMPPNLLSELGRKNVKSKGAVEEYIYNQFKDKFTQMHDALDYCNNVGTRDFKLEHFLDLFRNNLGLRRSIDKLYEIVVYAIFSSLIEFMGVNISINIKDPSSKIFRDFADFTQKILGITDDTIQSEYPAKLFRAGITNAADRGLDMWGNFGLAIQIKHLSLTEAVAEDVSNSVHADRIVIVCKDAEKPIIASIVSQLGWAAKIQAIVTFDELQSWYERAFNEKSYAELSKKILSILSEQIKFEFPSSDISHLSQFFAERDYKIT